MEYAEWGLIFTWPSMEKHMFYTGFFFFPAIISQLSIKLFKTNLDELM